MLFKTKFLEIKSKFHDYMSIYTEGSKQEEKVACSAVNKYETLDVRIPNNSLIFSAEDTAINLALISVKDIVYNKFIIFSDSLSVLKSLQHADHSNPLIQQILRRYFDLSRSKTVIFCWIPSHVSIQGNEEADQEAKHALKQPVSNIKIPYTDFKNQIRKNVNKQCQALWDKTINNKLYEIKSNFTDKFKNPITKKEQVVLSRCRIGHSYITYSFILKHEDKSFCISCQQNFTIKHVLFDSIDFLQTRNRFYDVQNIKYIFNISTNLILSFLKEMNIFNKL